MSKEPLSLKLAVIPPELQDATDMQVAVASLSPDNMESVLNVVLQKCKKIDDYRLFVMDLVNVSNKRPNQQKLFADFALQLLNRTPVRSALQILLLNFGTPQLVRFLYDAGIFTIDEIKRKCAYNDVFRFFFQPDINFTLDYLRNKLFEGIMRSYDDTLKPNDFAVLKEWIYDGWSKDTKGYILKHDLVDNLKDLVQDDPEMAKGKLKWSPFEVEIEDEIVTMLNAAAYFGSQKCFMYLAELIEDDEFDCAKYAVLGGNQEIISYCQKRNANFDDCQTWASASYRYQLFDSMLALDTVPPFLHMELTIRNFSVFFFLARKGFDPNMKQPKSELTLISIACSQGDINFVKYLLSKGAKPSLKSDEGAPIHSAALNGYAEIVKLLIDKGAKVDETDKGGHTPLHFASREGKTEVVKLLLEHGANPDQKNKWIPFIYIILMIKLLFNSLLKISTMTFLIFLSPEAQMLTSHVMTKRKIIVLKTEH